MVAEEMVDVSVTTVNRNGVGGFTGRDSAGDFAGGTGNGHAASITRRTELAAFLRSRRERISPEDVGLPAGSRRRTAGLRREELAQLAGVGVTWYTWLEQGRPINASVQVLDAVARTLKLDAAERAHLFRLADVPGATAVPGCAECPLPPEVQAVLDALPMPASVVSERFDVLAWNPVYASIFPGITSAPPEKRNTLLALHTYPRCCTPVEDPEGQCDAAVALLRAAHSKHLGDPAWTHLIRTLEAESPAFARAWASHDVAHPGSTVKVFRHPGVGRIATVSTSFLVSTVPGARMIVYTPSDKESEQAIARLAAGDQLSARFPCWESHQHQEERLELPLAAR
jgi:transcriptional regulator with XRE-family HTH domain